jgi:ABC-type nitrate/sulfonate/bicarbonate transport system permease component
MYTPRFITTKAKARRINRISIFRRAVVITSLMVVWEALSRIGLINPNILPSFTATICSIFKGITQGVMLNDAFQSLRRVLIGYSIAGTLALFLGTISGLSKSFRDIIQPLVNFIRPIPPIAWIPIALMWFGFGDPPAYFLVGLGAFFPIFSNAFLGVSLVERGPVEVGICHRASRQLLFWKIILPQALPSIFTGLRTGLGVAWMVVITAELVGAQSGLGYLIQVSRAQLQAEQVVAGMGMIGLIGYFLDVFVSTVAKMVMPWRRRGEELFNES